MSVTINKLDNEIKTIDEESIIFSKDEPKTFIKKVLYRSALNGDPSKETPEEAVDRWDLGRRIKESNGKVELSEKEFSSLRKDIAKSFGAEISGQAIKHLDICKAEGLMKDK